MQANIGDRVIVAGGFGTEVPQEVTVNWTDEHKGQLIIDYETADGQRKWAYMSQIVEVVERAT